VFYQELGALERAIQCDNPNIERFDASCFDGIYITGDISKEYLAEIENHREDGETHQSGEPVAQLDFNLSSEPEMAS